MKQQNKPTIENHSKIVMVQTGTPKYSRKAEKKRDKIRLFVHTSKFCNEVAKLEPEYFFEIFNLFMKINSQQHRK